MNNNFYIFNFNPIQQTDHKIRISSHKHKRQLITQQSKQLELSRPITRNLKNIQPESSIIKKIQQHKLNQLQKYKFIIQKKFAKSKINQTYRFPRDPQKQQFNIQININHYRRRDSIQSMKGTLIYKLQLQNKKNHKQPEDLNSKKSLNRIFLRERIFTKKNQNKRKLYTQSSGSKQNSKSSKSKEFPLRSSFSARENHTLKFKQIKSKNYKQGFGINSNISITQAHKM